MDESFTSYTCLSWKGFLQCFSGVFNVTNTYCICT